MCKMNTDKENKSIEIIVKILLILWPLIVYITYFNEQLSVYFNEVLKVILKK